jgi:hypothetical protein
MEREALRQLAEVDAERAFEVALEAIASPDRNLRVLALRIVGMSGRPGGAAAVIAGLGDPKKRVRRAALQAAGSYLDDPRVADALLSVWHTDPRSFGLVGRLPLEDGGLAPHARDVMQTVLRVLTESDRSRSELLARLAQLELTADVEALLNEFVRSGTKDEAVLATRALCGYRLVASADAGSCRWVRGREEGV